MNTTRDELPPFRCTLCDRPCRELVDYIAPSGTRRKACKQCIRDYEGVYVAKAVGESHNTRRTA